MSIKPPVLEFATHFFKNPAAFFTFLSDNGTTTPGIYLKMAKKASGISSLTAPEAVEVALCHGWIDGRANSIDDVWWTVRYTPRRAKSIWSQKNVNTVERLIKEGRMRPEGLVQVQAAKSDGRWERAYGGSAGKVVPKDLQDALDENESAKRVFDGFNQTKRHPFLHRLAIGSVKGREKILKAIVEELSSLDGRVRDKSVADKPVLKKKTIKPTIKSKVTSKKETTSRKAASQKSRGGSVEDTVKPSTSRREGLRTRPQA